MAKLKDLTGQKFGRWTVVSRAANQLGSRAYWNCICICGTGKHVYHGSLVYGKSISCGCHNNEARKARTKHGHTAGNGFTKTYSTWANMIARCTRESSGNYRFYGGSGITVCDQWLTFANFLKDMGNPPAGGSIERIDNTLGYSPENCRWATHIEQCNNRRNSRFITHNGETHTLSEWSRITGINRDTLKRRDNLGWPAEKVLTHPVIRHT